MAAPRGPRGEKATVVSWTAEDGTQYFELYAAAGLRGITKHKSAEDARKELIEQGVEEHLVIVQTLSIR